MTCTTCGRENPPHLTFCQECGQRLGPRIAPPTPPIGLTGQEPPRAPAIQGTPGPPPATTSERKCRVCETVNAAGLRYCTSCGSTLETAPAPAPPAPASPAPVAYAPPLVAAPPPVPPQPSPSPIAAPAPPAPAPFIAPARVVDLGAPAATYAAEPRSCPRCRGAIDPGAQFCKFCGASLAEVPPAPAPVQVIAPAPPPTAEPRPSNGAPPPVPARPPTSPMPQSQAARPPAAASAPPPAAPSPGPPAIAARPAASHGRLVVIAKSGADGPSYPIGDTLDIGRAEGHIIVGEDPYLSPRHVRLSFESGKLMLRDLGSTNGVFLRLAPVRDLSGQHAGKGEAGSGGEVAVPLQDQDLILVGQQVLRFELVRDGEAGFGPATEHGTLLFGSPAGPRYARLCQRTVEGITRDVYTLRKMETVLGRESGDVVFTEDPFLSRRHAAVRFLGRDGSLLPPTTKALPADARFALVDLGSSNGTFLRVRNEIELVRGDQFRVGQQLFRVDLDAGQAA